METILVKNDFVKYESLAKDSFLQSSVWAEFKNQTGWESVRIVVKEKSKATYMMQVLKKPLPMGYSLLYAPYAYFDKKYARPVLKEIKQYAKENNSVFFTLEAFEKKNDRAEKELKSLGLRKSLFRRYQPEFTSVLDISKTEDEILASMKQKGRYNIKIAQKNNVIVKKITDLEGLKDYKDMHEETEKRDGFTARTFSYLEKLFKLLTKSRSGCAYIAYLDKKPLAGIIVSYQGTQATYMYGASSNEYRNFMAPYLVQWTAIKDAKKIGMKTYDFFGTAPTDAPKTHKWAGITQFKEKFGGNNIEYVSGFDLVFKPLIYKALALVSKLRKVG